MRFEKLDAQEAALRGASHEAYITYDDLDGTADTSLTTTLATALPAGTRIEYVGHQLDTDFDGGSTSGLTAAIGWDLGSGTDDADGLLAAVELHADSTEIQYGPEAIADVDTSTVNDVYSTEESLVIASLRTKLNTVLKRGPKVFNDTADLEIVWTATGANLSTLTSGAVRFWFRINPAVTA